MLLPKHGAMSNGLGAGFFAITLLAVLAGLATLVVLAMIVSAVSHRRIGHTPTLLRYLLVLLCVGVLGVAGFGILFVYDETPAIAWLLTSIVVVPFLVVSVYLARSTGLSRFDVMTTTAMAWGVPFFLGVGVAVGVVNGIESVFDLAPAESRQMGVAWIAAAVGGLTTILGMIPIGNRLGRMVDSATTARERV